MKNFLKQIISEFYCWIIHGHHYELIDSRMSKYDHSHINVYKGDVLDVYQCKFCKKQKTYFYTPR